MFNCQLVKNGRKKLYKHHNSTLLKQNMKKEKLICKLWENNYPLLAQGNLSWWVWKSRIKRIQIFTHYFMWGLFIFEMTKLSNIFKTFKKVTLKRTDIYLIKDHYINFQTDYLAADWCYKNLIIKLSILLF